MKITFEVDVTPEEVQELFEGNMETLQKAILEFFMRQMPTKVAPDNDMITFWKSMAEQSTSMFEQYQQAMTGAAGKAKK